MCFSNFFPGKSRYCITEFEINPFIFDREDKYLAIDGYASFELKGKKRFDRQRENYETLDPFFHPETIAVLGVSISDNDKSGNVIVKNLCKVRQKKSFLC